MHAVHSTTPPRSSTAIQYGIQPGKAQGSLQRDGRLLTINECHYMINQSDPHMDEKPITEEMIAKVI